MVVLLDSSSPHSLSFSSLRSTYDPLSLHPAAIFRHSASPRASRRPPTCHGLEPSLKSVYRFQTGIEPRLRTTGPKPTIESRSQGRRTAPIFSASPTSRRPLPIPRSAHPRTRFRRSFFVGRRLHHADHHRFSNGIIIRSAHGIVKRFSYDPITSLSTGANASSSDCRSIRNPTRPGSILPGGQLTTHSLSTALSEWLCGAAALPLHAHGLPTAKHGCPKTAHRHANECRQRPRPRSRPAGQTRHPPKCSRLQSDRQQQDARSPQRRERQIRVSRLRQILPAPEAP
jgi:hypothetical protein